MFTLGICNGETSSACLFNNGELVSAASEERFSRIKMDDSMPLKSIEYVLSNSDLSFDDIDNIAYSWSKGFDEKLIEEYLLRGNELTSTNKSGFEIFIERINVEIKRDSERRNEFFNWAQKKLSKRLYSGIKTYYHHLAHASSASLLSPFSKGVVITSDGRGDFESMTISIYDKDKKNPLRKMYSNTSSDSLGFFYGRITGLLGFKPCRHEGKITGLAAKGNPDKVMDLMRRMINFDGEKIIANLSNFFRPFYTNYSNELIDELKNYSREDIAAAAQLHLEELLIKVISHIYKKFDLNGLPILMAGGVFGNVRVNQRIKELDCVGDAFVQPQMSDGGLCLGAAALLQHEEGYIINPIKNMYLGPKIDENFGNIIENRHNDLTLLKSKNITKELINYLSDEKVIGLVRGRMEFGPRALCNRSILYKTSDRSVNDWLNKRMSRTEFMPFAPVMTLEQGEKSFYNFVL